MHAVNCAAYPAEAVNYSCKKIVKSVFGDSIACMSLQIAKGGLIHKRPYAKRSKTKMPITILSKTAKNTRRSKIC
jgi:hypothetical protein